MHPLKQGHVVVEDTVTLLVSTDHTVADLRIYPACMQLALVAQPIISILITTLRYLCQHFFTGLPVVSLDFNWLGGSWQCMNFICDHCNFGCEDSWWACLILSGQHALSQHTTYAKDDHQAADIAFAIKFQPEHLSFLALCTCQLCVLQIASKVFLCLVHADSPY